VSTARFGDTIAPFLSFGSLRWVNLHEVVGNDKVQPWLALRMDVYAWCVRVRVACVCAACSSAVYHDVCVLCVCGVLLVPEFV